MYGPNYNHWGKGKMDLTELAEHNMLTARDDRARQQPWFLCMPHWLSQIEAVSGMQRQILVEESQAQQAEQ